MRIPRRSAQTERAVLLSLLVLLALTLISCADEVEPTSEEGSTPRPRAATSVREKAARSRSEPVPTVTASTLVPTEAPLASAEPTVVVAPEATNTLLPPTQESTVERRQASGAAPQPPPAIKKRTALAKSKPASAVREKSAQPRRSNQGTRTAQSVASPNFRGTVSLLGERTRALITPVLWRPGCPVPLEDLRLVQVDHWGFDGREKQGEIVVHKDEAPSIVQATRQLWQARFPIERMEPVNTYTGPSTSIAANNTTALNCRSVRGRPGVWSEHSYGRAIDINPVRNPYVAANGTILPPEGAPYTDRSRRALGMIRHDDRVVRAFEEIGWEWGGDWTDPIDYQHFSATGR